MQRAAWEVHLLLSKSSEPQFSLLPLSVLVGRCGASPYQKCCVLITKVGPSWLSLWACDGAEALPTPLGVTKFQVQSGRLLAQDSAVKLRYVSMLLFEGSGNREPRPEGRLGLDSLSALRWEGQRLTGDKSPLV